MSSWWSRTSWRTKLSVITVGALAWRLVYVKFELGYLPLTDEAWYIGQAHNLFGAHPWTSIFDFNIPTAQHGPLTSILLAPVAWLIPHATISLRLIMAIVGAATVAMCALAARELGGDRVGVIGGCIAAALPDLWIRDGLVVSEPVAALLVVTAVWIVLRTRVTIRYGHVVALGALCGLMALARAEITPIMVFLTMLACWRHGSRQFASRIVAAMLVAAAVIAPWSWYNSSRFADPVLISNNFGTTLVGANCPDTYFGSSLIGYDSISCEFRAQRAAARVSSDESVQSSILRRQAQHFVSQHLSRVPEVVAMRELWFLGVYRPGWVVHMGTLGGQPAWATWLQALSFYALFPLSLWMWWKNRRRNWPHWMLGALSINSFVVVGLFVGHWRYRVTLDIAMVLLLAMGFATKSKVARDSNAEILISSGQQRIASTDLKN